MDRILIFDEQNYTDDMPVYERTGVRAVIMRDGKVAMQRSRKGIYKLPGGGMEEGESEIDALEREVEEETGFLIDRDTVKEVGEILELREDVYKKGQKFIQHSLIYTCDIREEMGKLHMTDSEVALGFMPVWVTIDEIIENNSKVCTQAWQERDTLFLKWFRQSLNER